MKVGMKISIGLRGTRVDTTYAIMMLWGKVFLTDCGNTSLMSYGTIQMIFRTIKLV